MDLDASVAWPAFEHVRVVVVEEAVEQRRDGGGPTEQFSLVLDGAIEGEHYVGLFVTAHDELT